MSEPAALWTTLLPRKGDSELSSARRHDYCRKVLSLLAEKHPDLYSGKQGAALTIDEARSLVGALQKNSPGHVFKHRISYLVSGLEKGTLELGWNVAIPEPPLVIPREKPRFTHESFTALPDVYAIESAFLKNLKLQPPATYTTRVGQLLLSAILFGGLVRKWWLTPWVAALATVRCEGPVLWMDMVLTPDQVERERRASGKTVIKKADHSNLKESWEIRRRWFADPLTHALILCWHNEYQDDLNAGRDVSPLVAIRQYLNLILNTSYKVSETFVMALLQGSATRLGLGVPSFLLGYAEGKNKSVSLPPAVWERLLTGKCVISREEIYHEDEEPPPIDEPLSFPKSSRTVPLVQQENMLKEVLKNILPTGTSWKRNASDARESLQTYYDDHSEVMCQALSCLVLWCIDLLTTYNRQELVRGRVKSSIRASSVRRYLDAIGKRLIAAANNQEILNFESDELHDLYREVIEACSTKNGQNIAGARLYGFHQFLNIRLGAPAVDFSDLSINSGPVEVGVKANLISYDSFDFMKKVLCPDYTKASRMRKMQMLIAIIAFRCGLRRMECLKLCLIDLQGEAEPELLVRNNRYAYVKSSESIRRLPLACLLEKEELQLLLGWRRDRKLEDGSLISNSLLFCLEDQPTLLLSSHEVLLPIVQALRQVTGDISLVFHHFRHSFATWLALRLLNNFSLETRQRYRFLNNHVFDPANCDWLRKSLLGNHILGRQVLYLVAQLCGHSGPEVTLLHYIHLCDWLLGIEVSTHNNQPRLDAATIKSVTGLPLHILYYDNSKHSHGAWHMSLVLERLKIPSRLKSSAILGKVDMCITPDKLPAHLDSKVSLWRRVYAVIRERQLGNVPFNVLATRNGFSEKEVEAWCTNVAVLAGMKTHLGNPRHVNGATCRKNPEFNFPQHVRLPEDRNMSGIILSCFETSRGRKKQDIIDGTRHFVANYSVGEGGVLCKTPREIRKQVRFLLSLNIPCQQIHIIRIQPRTSRLTPAAEQKLLAHKIQIPESSITVRALYAHEYARAGAFLVQVRNSQPDKRDKIKSNYGFRFAMYMIAIIAGLSDEPKI